MTDKYVTQSARGRIDSGKPLVSGSISPSSNEMVYVEVAIPGNQEPGDVPCDYGCSTSWSSPIAEQLIQGQTLNGYVGWFARMPAVGLAR